MPSEGRRDARTSRDSDATGTGSRPQAKGKSTNGTLDGWVEPSLAAKPSFEDHGGAPYGVLEHMQPLGEPPSTRVRARVKGDGARKSMAGKGAAGLGLDAQDTPEGTPGPQYSSQATDALPPLPPIAMDDEEDEDYAPGKKSKKKERAAKPRAAKRQSESAGPSNETPPPGKGRGKGRKAADKAAAEAAQIAREDAAWETAKESLLVDNVNQNTVYDARKLRIVVNEAKRRATAVGKPAMGEAVEEVYQQSLSNTRLTWLLEAVLLQTANKEDMDEFHDYVRKAKRKLKEAEQKASDSANGKQPLPVRTPAKEEQISRVKEEAPAIPSTEKSELPRPKFSIKVKSPPKPTAHSRPTQSEPMSSSPAKQQSADLDDNASELSELTELSEGEEMDRDDDVGSHTAPSGRSSRVNGVKIKDQAAERGSLGVQSNNLKRSSADAEIHETEQDRVLSAKKLKLSGSVQRDYDWQESHVRGSLARGSRGAGTKNGGVVPPKITLHPGGAGNAGARGSRAVSTDAESPLSSPALSSRRSTPHVWKGPPKQPGKRAKTKTSPEKKHQHSYGSLTGAGGAGRDSPIGDDDNEELSENNDFCSSCGGSGFLLCCDGCDRAFHFTCLDPPIKEEASELNEPWYCFICVAKRPASIEQPERPAQGLFAPLLTSLNKSNPKTFQLPESVRSYFESVATAKNGEFTEAVKPKTRRGGLDEKPDDFKLKDNKGNSVLCYACNKSSLGKRPIIGCDYCSQCWHLDCVDPPLANPPNRDHLGFKTGDWMCPLHADHELRQVETRLLKPARRVHIRKPRQAKTMQTALQRGLQNNGVIEIADDESDDSDSEFYEDDREPAIVYKMPAQGIKLDFIDKVKQTRVQDSQIERLSKRIKLDNAMNAPSALSQANFTRRSIREQQTALSLAQFANANPDLDLGGDRVENLVGALIAEAPSDVVDTIAAAEGRKGFQPNGIKKSPSPPSSQHTESLSSEERRELEMLQELIKRKLEGGKP